MGFKENIDALKQEISTEEQFLESIIKGERFFKKYKKVIISLVAIALVGFVAYAINSFVQGRKIEASNEAYKILLSNPQDANALEKLKNNNNRLYNLFLFSQAMKENNIEGLKEIAAQKKDDILSDIASYQLATLQSQPQMKTELLKGLALLQNGYKLILEEKMDEAKLQFAQIELSSPLKNIANSLEHYQGK